MDRNYRNIIIVGDSRVGKTRFRDMVTLDWHVVETRVGKTRSQKLVLNEFESKPYVPTYPVGFGIVGRFCDASGIPRVILFTEVGGSERLKSGRSDLFANGDGFIVLHKGDSDRDKWSEEIRKSMPDAKILTLNVNDITSRRYACDWMDAQFGKNMTQDEETMARTYEVLK